MHDNIAAGNLDRKMTARWFPFIGTCSCSSVLESDRLHPLPTNTEHYIHVFGFSFRRLALCGNGEPLDPLVLALMVSSRNTYEASGQGADGY